MSIISHPQNGICPIAQADVIDPNSLYNPKYYEVVEVLGHQYVKPIRIGIGFNDKLKKAYREKYASLCPTELQADGSIDKKKYDSWLETNQFEEPIKRTYLTLTFLPVKGSPTIDEIYDYFPQPIYVESYNFFDEVSPASTSGPSASASSGSDTVAQPVDQK